MNKMNRIEEIICKYDGITNIHEIRELIHFDCEEMLKKIIKLEADIDVLKSKQRNIFANMAKVYVDYVDSIVCTGMESPAQINATASTPSVCSINSNELMQDTAAYNALQNKFSIIAKSYRIARRNHKTNIQNTINILNIINKYKKFLNNINDFIVNKEYDAAKKLLSSNLALYKNELSLLIPDTELKKISIITKLNNKASKLINLLKNK